MIENNPITLTFLASEPAGPPVDSLCVTITILDDAALESDRDFSVTITDVGPFAILNSQSTTTTVTIIDNESRSQYMWRDCVYSQNILYVGTF